MEERLQKILSERGAASRRAAEEYLRAGRVTVNGSLARLGDKADPETDDIRLDGAAVDGGGKPLYLMLHKPPGYVTTLSDEKGRRTVAELVAGCGGRVWPVGRLDLNSQGLLLMTNDGALTNRLLHPSSEVEKEYLVEVRGELSARTLAALGAPMMLDGQALRPAKVELVRDSGDRGTLRMTIHEGKNRQIRRMCGAVGLKVTRLARVREGPLTLGQLAPGRWRRLTRDEVEALRRL